MNERLLSVRELSQITGWNPMTIYRKASKGEIPGRIKLGKRSIRFKESDIEAWLKALDQSKKAREEV